MTDTTTRETPDIQVLPVSEPVPWTAGRLLRALTGVDEQILAKVPTERARYTAMGGLVLGTALAAMFSMSVAMYSIFGEFVPVAFIFVPVWGMFILSLDRWLMSSAGVSRTLARFFKLLPRFVLAVMFGVIIAEPLLLGVFHTAIEERVNKDRQMAVEAHQTLLVQCNPPPTTAGIADIQAQPKCKDKVVTSKTGADAKQSELDTTTSDATALKARIDSQETQYQKLESKARAECVGDKGPGLTGHAGWGKNCLADRADAKKYRTDNRMDEENKQYSADEARIAKLSKDIGDTQQNQAQSITDAINADVTAFKANQDRTKIGLLERFKALGELVKGGGYVLAAEWGLRIFFVTVDALPVITKFLSGNSTYDKIAADLLQRQERAQRVANETARRDLVMREEMQRHLLNVEHNAGRKRVDIDGHLRHIDVEISHANYIDQRTAELLGDTPTVAFKRLSAGKPDKGKR